MVRICQRRSAVPPVTVDYECRNGCNLIVRPNCRVVALGKHQPRNQTRNCPLAPDPKASSVCQEPVFEFLKLLLGQKSAGVMFDNQAAEQPEQEDHAPVIYVWVSYCVSLSENLARPNFI